MQDIDKGHEYSFKLLRVNKSQGEISAQVNDFLIKLETAIQIERNKAKPDFERRILSELDFASYGGLFPKVAEILQLYSLPDWTAPFKGLTPESEFSSINFSKKPNRVAFFSLLMEYLVMNGICK